MQQLAMSGSSWRSEKCLASLLVIGSERRWDEPRTHGGVTLIPGISFLIRILALSSLSNCLSRPGDHSVHAARDLGLHKSGKKAGRGPCSTDHHSPAAWPRAIGPRPIRRWWQSPGRLAEARRARPIFWPRRRISSRLKRVAWRGSTASLCPGLGPLRQSLSMPPTAPGARSERAKRRWPRPSLSPQAHRGPLRRPLRRNRDQPRPGPDGTQRSLDNFSTRFVTSLDRDLAELGGRDGECLRGIRSMAGS
jgi:hypothetical protein